jgi:hypothetical protein
MKNPPQQAKPCPCGCSSGVRNYCNDILVDIVRQLIAQNLEAWRNVALLYQNALNESKNFAGGRIFMTIG